MASLNMQNLPNELVAHILSFLDSESHLQRRIYLDPAKLTRPVSSAPNTPLKNASLVCRLWRISVMKLLFRYVVWPLWRFYKPVVQDIASQIELLDFIRRNNLSSSVDHFTILIDLPLGSGQNRYPDGQFWGILPPVSQQPETPMSWNLLWSVLNQEDRDAEGSDTRTEEDRAQCFWDNNWLWHTIFDVIDPLRITMISSIDILASLLSRTVDLSSHWAFNSTYYVLSLSRPSRSIAESKRVQVLPSHIPGSMNRIPCDLFHIRDWSSVLINEGSFAPVYSTYEFFHYSAATLLPAIFDSSDPSFDALCANLHSLSYIATFPLSHHISDHLIPNCPPVEHLYVQLMPKNRDFWESSSLSRVNLSDLWLECDTSYALLVRQLLQTVPQPGWQKLKVFETGDTPAEGVWKMNTYDGHINGSNGWREDSEGVFVKDDIQSSNEQTMAEES
ncbi:uncharacterized protein FMAN_07357 [Fusarium mangiferae]|uniref:F-box domain-containing protein n=1 Tax=Fusarium mangiferae TaxID=192010 RepID=A0A1L7TAY0_FUSMA|nr:uncharacterized protein FMAN_07357 [Fusarium mangiferae]CVK92461.1 uncharacterized protein FMAN_07357 [Fusarium mangiferae]